MPALRLTRDSRYYFYSALVYFVTFLVILPITCNDIKFSIYYGVIWPRNITHDSQTLRNINEARLQDEQQYLQLAVHQRQKSLVLGKVLMPRDGVDIVITVITVSRKRSDYNPRYVTQTVSQLSRQLTSRKLAGFTYGLMICNVDNAGQEFQEAKDLSQLFHTVHKYDDNRITYENRFEKEKQDYIYCLEKSLFYHPKHILMMEDDAYPLYNMLPVLESSIHNIFEHRGSDVFRYSDKIAFVKLYHPERLLNFISTEPHRLFELAGAISLLFMVFYLFTKHVLHTRHIPLKHYCNAFVFVLLIALAMGRQNFLWIRGLSHRFYNYVPVPSCCMPANLYSNASAIDVMKSFSAKQSYGGYAKDTILDEFLKESNYRAIYVEPNIFKHIGQYSSLRRGSILDPFVV